VLSTKLYFSTASCDSWYTFEKPKSTRREGSRVGTTLIVKS